MKAALPLALAAMLAMPAGAQTADHLQGTLDQTAEQVLSAREQAEANIDNDDDDPAEFWEKVVPEHKRTSRKIEKAPPTPRPAPPTCIQVKGKPLSCLQFEPAIMKAYGLKFGQEVTPKEAIDIDHENRGYLQRQGKTK